MPGLGDAGELAIMPTATAAAVIAAPTTVRIPHERLRPATMASPFSKPRPGRGRGAHRQAETARMPRGIRCDDDSSKAWIQLDVQGC
ncbi:hypothetical protein GCM10010168_38600 [Actinoplanes ianthinogenes]|uniref:Uncharacterized protein n=1 Tax=Actinoplanes ianthinogenes TaxID=122358 RepID=A0ABN6CN72_9ACTN|nr:hypothetical protein Aiant_72740 [Actinoplanes ianthinogenes]GGR16924.1 hypothetical protein GCM10010168_38600 [Actinoplanes ianthinogenes]